MARSLPRPWTVEDFLVFEAEEPERYEFVDGIVRMMTGGSAAHSAIKLNLAVALRASLRSGPCRVDVDGLKVVTASAVIHPDVLVICRPLAPDDDRVADPTVVAEVISPSTEAHDRVRKWREYSAIASLRHFVPVAQKERRIEVYTRSETGWELAIIKSPEDAIPLKAVGATLSLDAIYQDSGR